MNKPSQWLQPPATALTKDEVMSQSKASATIKTRTLFDNSEPAPKTPPSLKADPNRLGYIGAKPGKKKETRDSDSWFTPSKYIDAACRAFGQDQIDFDPFSSAAANKTVKAKEYFTIEDNALEKPWPGSEDKKRAKNGMGVKKGRLKSVWMNPPYSSPLCGDAIRCFVKNFDDNVFESGIILVNNTTDNLWAQELLRGQTGCRAVCFTQGRIKFWNADGKPVSGNTRGQMFFFFTHNRKRIDAFRKAFSEIGACLMTEASYVTDTHIGRRVVTRKSLTK